MSEKLFIGVDIGTKSVGVVMTDEEYNVVKHGDTPMACVRLFDEAKTAKERRLIRGRIIRKNREKQRLQYLESFFKEEIEKVDPAFLSRLKVSSYWEEDKIKAHEYLENNKDLGDDDFDQNSLFKDLGFTDKSYYKLYPTIYHLRDFLIQKENWTDTKKPDIRFVHLAIHHILKHRGHFLWNDDIIKWFGQNSNVQGDIFFEELNNSLEILNDSEDDELKRIPLFDLANLNKIYDILLDIGKTILEKKNELSSILNTKKINRKKSVEQIIAALAGGQFDLNKLFNIKLSDDDKKLVLKTEWEETEPLLSSMLDDDEFVVIEKLKNIFDFVRLRQALGDNTSISKAMIEKYNEHKKDLEMFKEFVKRVPVLSYEKMFNAIDQANSTKKLGNYANYVGFGFLKSNSRKVNVEKVSQEKFYEFVKKEFSKIPVGSLSENDQKDLDYFNKKIENQTFLPKQRSTDNSIFPYQLHEYELKLILENAEKFYNFLNNKDEDELSNCKTIKEKILSLISFRVPYYVGHLSSFGSNAWSTRLIKGVDVTPWNFQKVINHEQSAEDFIRRMQGKCTYLKYEDVLPKNSLLYSKYMVLDELNNLRIRGKRLDNETHVALKQHIYNDLFRKNKTVTAAKLVRWLKTNLDKELCNDDISGYFDTKKGKFVASLAPVNAATKIIKKWKPKDENVANEIIEKVISWQAFFREKELIKGKIDKEFRLYQIPEEIVDDLLKLNYKGFGKLSRKFLTDSRLFDFKEGLINDGNKSIIDLLWETNKNLMEIIHDKKYKIQKWLDVENKVDQYEFSYQEDIANSYGAPSVKRAVWQTIKTIDEMIELNDGRIPDKIFVEVLRGRGSKDNQEKETKPRKEQLQELYNEVEKIKLKEWKDLTIVEKEKMTLVSDELIKQLHKKTNLDLQETRLFLYFKQCGKSAYTNKPINIDKLSSDYEIDHIIPKNKIKDNSFDNLVLVESRINKRKADNYPLNKTSAIWNKKDELKATWSQWKKYGLMTQKKYERLTREKELTDDEMRESVTNQLVFTGQAAILVANILKKRFAKEKVEIVYSKAKLVSEFRQKFDLLKCREINNQHHVHDAYLNIVVGNVYNERFTHDIDKWDNLNVNRYSQKNLFEYSIPYRNSNSYVWRVKDNKPKRSDFTGDDKQQLYQEKKNEWLQDSPSVKTVKAFVLKQNYKVTKKVAENGGAFYNENIIKSDYKQRDVRKGTIMKDTINQIPIKQHANDPKTHGTQKYGHYSEKQYAYCIIIEYTKRSSKQKKGERQKRFVPLSVFDKNRINKITEKRLKEEISLNNVENSALRSKEIEKEEIIKWLEESYSDPRIIRLKVYKDTLFELDGTPVRLSGFMEWQNAVQWYVDKEHTEYIRLFAKLDDFLKRGIIKIEKKKKNEGENNENADLKQKKSENTEKTEENEVIEQDELVNDERITLSKGKHEQILTRQKNLDLFVLIKKQLEKRIYKGNTALYRKITDKMQTEFEHLVVIDQIDILKDLIKGLQCNGARGNLKKILGPSSFGRYTKAPEIISKKLVLIEESYTGIKTKHTKIN